MRYGYLLITSIFLAICIPFLFGKPAGRLLSLQAKILAIAEVGSWVAGCKYNMNMNFQMLSNVLQFFSFRFWSRVAVHEVNLEKRDMVSLVVRVMLQWKHQNQGVSISTTVRPDSWVHRPSDVAISAQPFYSLARLVQQFGSLDLGPCARILRVKRNHPKPLDFYWGEAPSACPVRVTQCPERAWMDIRLGGR